MGRIRFEESGEGVGKRLRTFVRYRHVVDRNWAALRWSLVFLPVLQGG
jgi:hypothetical protein